MPIEFRCTQCNRLLRTPDDAAGRNATCPQCGATLIIPTPGEIAVTPPAEPASGPPASSGEPSPFGPSVPPPGAGVASGPQASPSPYPSPTQPPEYEYQPAARGTDGKALASLILGISSMIVWCCPLIGLPVAGTGLILGIVALKGPSRGMAIAGVVLSVLGLLLALAMLVLNIILFASGEM
ncbi:MAG TPA: hypothetical protein VMY37_27005 [Thermoguttaceae bacterium]|nr:hypothetical protein [Thermoguttaceae bacterium]